MTMDPCDIIFHLEPPKEPLMCVGLFSPLQPTLVSVLGCGGSPLESSKEGELVK